MFGYPCTLKIELSNFLLISMLFSSDEVVQHGIWRCHTLWPFCVRLLPHFPSLLCSLLHSKLTKPLLLGIQKIPNTQVFSKLLIHGAVSWVFSISSVFHKVGFPRLKTAAPAEALQEQCHPTMSYRVSNARRQQGSSRLAQTGPMFLQPPLITPCQKLLFSILNPVRILDLFTSIGKLFQTFILWYRYSSNFQIKGFHKQFKPIS